MNKINLLKKELEKLFAAMIESTYTVPIKCSIASLAEGISNSTQEYYFGGYIVINDKRIDYDPKLNILNSIYQKLSAEQRNLLWAHIAYGRTYTQLTEDFKSYRLSISGIKKIFSFVVWPTFFNGISQLDNVKIKNDQVVRTFLFPDLHKSEP